MPSDLPSQNTTSPGMWTGRILSTLVVLFLLMDGVMKLFQPTIVVETTTKLGYPAYTIFPLGVVLLICTILYCIPRLSLLGAILLTGYLGGAVATHVRVGNGLFEMLFPIILAVFIWGGLVLRDTQLRKLMF